MTISFYNLPNEVISYYTYDNLYSMISIYPIVYWNYSVNYILVLQHIFLLNKSKLVPKTESKKWNTHSYQRNMWNSNRHDNRPFMYKIKSKFLIKFVRVWIFFAHGNLNNYRWKYPMKDYHFPEKRGFVSNFLVLAIYQNVGQ